MSAKLQTRSANIEAQLPTDTATAVPGAETLQLGAVSQRKLKANRENARKSTGPRTARGKANSRRNTIKHGLFATGRMAFAALGENSQEYERLLNDLCDEHQPIGRAEELEVERIALCWWKLRRASRYENSVNHVAVRDVAVKELARQEEYCQTLDKEEEAMILELRGALGEIEATGEVPQDLKQKVFATRPKFEALWPLFEKSAEEVLKAKLGESRFAEITPLELSLDIALITILVAILFIEELRRFRTAEVWEIAHAQHAIPDRESLDRILRYETAIEKNLGRALDRLERLQRRRRGEPVLPPVSVRLMQ